MEESFQIKCNTCGELFTPIKRGDGISITCYKCIKVYKPYKDRDRGYVYGENYNHPNRR